MRQRHRLQPNQDDDFRVSSCPDLAQASQQSARVVAWLLGSIASVSLVFSGAGGLLGVFLGIAAALAIDTLSELPVSIVPWSVGLAFLFPGLVGVISDLYPVRKAAGLRPVDALHCE